MNEYNERILKNVLQDSREENNEDILKEIEAAANDPIYQNSPGEAEKFAENYSKTAKKKYGKILSRVAAVVLVLAIGSAVIPVTVEGRKNTVAELIINYVNSEFFAVDNEEPLITFEGKYVPTWIPDGYEVESITNTPNIKEIVLRNSDGKMITYKEQPPEFKMNIDSTTAESVSKIEINGLNAIYIEEDGMRKIMITASDSILYIVSNDVEINLIGFAKKIEKR